MLGIDQEREGAPFAERGHLTRAQHGSGVLRKVHPVAREVPAIGGLAHALEDFAEIEARVVRVLARAACAALRLRALRRRIPRFGAFFRRCTQLTAPLAVWLATHPRLEALCIF
jgi:hypothetical protein